MTGIALAIVSAIFLAFAQVILRKSYKDFKPSIAFFFDALFGLLLWAPLALIMGVSLGANWQDAIIFAIISAIISEAFYFYALSHGELAVTATVLATYPVYTVFFSYLLNNERLSAGLLVFVGFAIAGSIAASLPGKVNKNELRLRTKVMWPFIAAIGIGLSDTISKGYINRSGDFSFLFALAFVQLPIALAYMRIEKQKIRKALIGTCKQLRTYRYALLGGLFNIIGTGFLWLSFSFAPASIASPITGISGALTVLLSRLTLGERISTRKYLAIAVAFIGVLGIAILKAD